MTKTRGIMIKRTETVLTEDKKGNPVEQKQERWFPCRINSGITDDHRLVKNEGYRSEI